MKNEEYRRDLLGDAYTASSLLQKAIRRGETELALLAARRLLPKRGKGIWRRLLAVAFEDVGAANVEALVRVLELAEGQMLDRSIAPERGLKGAIVALSESPKSRSADHLICSARHLIASKSLAECRFGKDTPSILAVAGDPSQTLIARMAALIDTGGRNPRSARAVQIERVSALKCVLPHQAHVAVELSLRGFKILKDGIVWPLPLLTSALAETENAFSMADQEMPETAFHQEVPTWVWDKHTSIGKRAFRKLITESISLRQCLDHYVCPENHLAAACMAGFYLDAAPVKHRFEWPGSMELELAGRAADMRKAGCPPCGIEPLLDTVAHNMDHLNAIRVELAGGKPSCTA